MATLSVHVFPGGERMPLLLDGNGVPLFYPTLFATSQLRNRGDAVNTIRNKLAAIEVLHRWEAAEARDLIAEFGAARTLNMADIASLRDFAGLDMRHVKVAGGSHGRVARSAGLEARITSVAPLPTVGREQQYDRLSAIADYLEFLASVLTQHRGSPEDSTAIDKMATTIRRHRPRGWSSRIADDSVWKSPPTAVVERFMAAMAVDSPDNPFRDPGIRLRNAIIFGLFRWTGMRRGELLSLKIEQIDFGDEPIVWVRRNQDDLHDSRRNQPSAKTKERPLPLPESLADQIQNYILNVRAKIKPARTHSYLIVGHRGDRLGQPLTVTGLGSSTMSRARKVDPAFAQIHPHAFRHYFNYELSERIDAHNAEARSQVRGGAHDVITDAKEADLRAFLNGHRSTASGQAYNQRHVREQADRAVRQIQSTMMDTARSTGDAKSR